MAARELAIAFRGSATARSGNSRLISEGVAEGATEKRGAKYNADVLH